MNEMQLYQKMKAGDATAFDQLFKMNYERLVNLAYRKVDDLAIAEDIVQNVFIEFWKKGTSWNIESSVGAYLKKIVNNRCIDFFRKEKTLNTRKKNFLQNSPTLDISSPEEELLSQESLQAIYQKIESLPRKCKIVFKLSRFEGLSYKAISEELNISIKTVEFHISTALRILRESLFIVIVFVGSS